MKKTGIKKAAGIYVLAAFFMLNVPAVFSFNQVKDKLVIGKDTFDILKCGFVYLSPLQSVGDFSEKIAKEYTNGMQFASECRRGYIAEWTMIDSVLYLIDVYGYDPERSFQINGLVENILHRKFENGMMRADWFNEGVWCGTGKITVSGEELYDQEQLLFFQKGKLVDTKVWNVLACDTWNGKDFSSYVFQKINWKKFPKKLKENIVTEFYMEFDTVGRVTKVQLTSGNDGKYHEWIREAIYTLSCLPVYCHLETIILSRREKIIIDQAVLDRYKSKKIR